MKKTFYTITKEVDIWDYQEKRFYKGARYWNAQEQRFGDKDLATTYPSRIEADIDNKILTGIVVEI